jgi:hypothetical protein
MNTLGQAACAAAIAIAASALPAGAQSVPTHASTEAEQTDVAVTVYNGGRALVRDRRNVTLSEGEVALQFKDVAEQILPETVSLRAMNAPEALRILEQNYEYDLLSPDKLMEKYIGRGVRLVNKDSEYNFTEVPATLLSTNGGPVYQVGEDIYLGHPGSVVLPEIPEELIARPTLVWLLQSAQAEYDIEASYLTGGISWKADYVLRLDQAGSVGDLEGWVTLENQSGGAYRNALLKLVAGDVNLVQPEMRGRQLEMMAMAYAPAAKADMGGMEQEAFGEFHLYTLPRRTTIRANQTKQVSLLGAAGVQTRRVYEVEAGQWYFSQPMGEEKNLKPAAYLLFDNKEANQLGVPLPGGVVRVYQEDRSGALQFTGEDRIQHTPKDEEVRLRLGTVFDVVVDRKQTDYRRIADNVHSAAYEFSVRNRKDEDVVIDFVERFGGEWTLLEQSIQPEKRDAATAVFHVPVKAGEEVTVTYRVQVRY